MFGYELPDTIMVYTETTVVLLSSKKKIDFLKPAESKGENGLPTVKLLIRDKASEFLVLGYTHQFHYEAALYFI